MPENKNPLVKQLATHKLTFLIIGAFVIDLTDLPSDIHVLLKLFICSIMAYWTYTNYRLQRIALAWIFGTATVLFNPVFPLKLEKDTWDKIDLLTAITISTPMCFKLLSKLIVKISENAYLEKVLKIVWVRKVLKIVWVRKCFSIIGSLLSMILLVGLWIFLAEIWHEILNFVWPGRPKEWMNGQDDGAGCFLSLLTLMSLFSLIIWFVSRNAGTAKAAQKS